MAANPSKETRQIVLGRDQHRCVVCETYLRPGQWPGMSIHHRLRRSQGSGEDELHEPSNLISVCGMDNSTGCHGWIHQHPNEAVKLGYLIRSYDDHKPSEVPIFNQRYGWQLLSTDGQATPCKPPTPLKEGPTK
ncbi:hypothetical protein JS533_007535 [Bifidobacterium amazonense]|uniref:HNH endonuclease n=1 Tax=Bifidobacterium amazonense TaxID=2809027 RepID=A0ABS9VVJ0_9BIFI|nr:hypothetical protein [Bifidobacterium amazonense]MCH9276121.1 hypothetical protein [Bifidobacterium amazonense]